MTKREHDAVILSYLMVINDWASTYEIAQKTKIHFYKVIIELNNLANECKVRRKKMGSNTFWKVWKDNEPLIEV